MTRHFIPSVTQANAGDRSRGGGNNRVIAIRKSDESCGTGQGRSGRRKKHRQADRESEPAEPQRTVPPTSIRSHTAGHGSTADLQMVEIVADPGPVGVGNRLDYNITIANNGPLAVSDPEIILDLPSGVTPTDPSCVLRTSVYVCPRGPIASGGTDTATISVQVGLNAPSTITITPLVTTGAPGDPVRGNNFLENTTEVTTTEVGGTPDTENRTHNNLNQISAIDSAPLVYDANGNLTDDGTFLYAWDAKNRLRTVTRKSDSVVVGRYSYDALGRRILRIYVVGTDPAVTVHYYLDGQRVIEERQLPTPDSLLPDELARQYTYGLYIDEALTLDRDLNSNGVATDSGERLFYHANSLYSVFGLSASDRVFAERYLYDSYGRPIIWLPGPDALYGTADDVRNVNGSSTVQNGRLFTGREWDAESLLFYFRARYQSPRLGRFLSRDPLGTLAGTSIYHYVENQPLDQVDPSGLLGSPCTYKAVTPVECFLKVAYFCKAEKLEIAVPPMTDAIEVPVVLCRTKIEDGTPLIDFTEGTKCKCVWEREEQTCKETCCRKNGIVTKEIVFQGLGCGQNYGKMVNDPIGGWMCRCSDPTPRSTNLCPTGTVWKW